MHDNVDRRMSSTTARGLSEFIGDLANSGIYSTSVRDLWKVFKEREIYPATLHISHPTFTNHENDFIVGEF